MPKPIRISYCLALALAVLSPAAARAEIIDFDPAADAVPEILPPDEISRYNQLVAGISRPSVSSLGPDGRYAIVAGIAGQQGTRILDTTTKEVKALPTLETGLLIGSPYLWISPHEVLVLTYRVERNPQGQVIRQYDFARTTLDLESGTASSHPFTPAVLAGRALTVLTGRPFIRTTDGTYHVAGYTAVPAPFGADVVEVERPTFDARTPEELEALGQAPEPQSILQTDVQLVIVSTEDGALKPIGSLAAGAGMPGTFAQRPGANTVAYVVTRGLPWAGIVVGGRASRGGGMPTSYWNTQENLGFIPERENRHLTYTSLSIVDLDTGQRKVVENVDHPGGKFATPMWTADGNWLAVVVQRPSVLKGRKYPIYEYAAGTDIMLFTPDGQAPPGGAVTQFPLGRLDPPMDISASLRPLDGTRMFVQVPVNTTRHAYIVDIAKPDQAPEPVYTGDAYLFGNAYYGGGKLIALLGDVADPGDLYLGAMDDFEDTKEKLTASNGRLAGLSELAYRSLSFHTSNGFDIEGVYVYPADWSFPPARPMPLVVWQAGGPGGQMTNTWGTSVESPYSLLPNFGIPVLVVNGAGRTSNGARFYSAMADDANFGQRDILDVKEAVEQLIEQNIADADAIGVTGCSYGGYFTLQSITEHPDFYAAANSQCSLNDVMWEYNFGWSPFLAYLMGRSTTADPAEYIRDAPTFNAYKIKTPLLQFHGTDDFLPFEHITNIHDQVDANGVDTVFFRGKGYGHGIGNIGDAQGNLIPNSGANGQRYAFQLQLKWFRDHLGITEAAAARAVWSRPLLPSRPFEREVR